MSYEYAGATLAIDIHGYAKRVRNALLQIEHRDMSEQDKQDIIKFSTLLRVQELNLGRVTKYIYSLKEDNYNSYLDSCFSHGHTELLPPMMLCIFIVRILWTTFGRDE